MSSGRAAEGQVLLDRTALKRLLRQRGWSPGAVAAMAHLPGRLVYRAVFYGEASSWVRDALASVLAVPPAELELKTTQVVLDGEKVHELMRGMSFREFEAASGKTVSQAAIARARYGHPVARSIAEHIATALGVSVDDLVAKEAP